MEYWIGLHDRVVENRFEWSSQRAVNFTFWNIGEPNNWGKKEEDCVHRVKGIAGRWNDNNCMQKRTYVCSFPKGGPALKYEPSQGAPPPPDQPTIQSNVALIGITASQFDATAQEAFKRTIAVKVSACGMVALPAMCTSDDVSILSYHNLIRRSGGSVSVQFSLSIRSAEILALASQSINNYITSPVFRKDLAASGGNLAKVTGTVVIAAAAEGGPPKEALGDKDGKTAVIVTLIITTTLLLICGMCMCTYAYVHTTQSGQVNVGGLTVIEMANGLGVDHGPWMDAHQDIPVVAHSMDPRAYSEGNVGVAPPPSYPPAPWAPVAAGNLAIAGNDLSKDDHDGIPVAHAVAYHPGDQAGAPCAAPPSYAGE